MGRNGEHLITRLIIENVHPVTAIADEEDWPLTNLHNAR